MTDPPMTNALAAYRPPATTALAVYRPRSPPWHIRVRPRLRHGLVAAAAWLVGAAPVRLLMAGSVLGAGLSLAALALSAPVVAALGFAALWRWRKRGPPELSHGSARLATTAELEDEAMLGDTGLAIGAVRTPYPSWGRMLRTLLDPRVSHRDALRALGRGGGLARVRLATSYSVACFSPPGGGKSSGIAIPVALECRNSLIFVDMKGKIWAATAECRRRMGHEVVVIDPFHVTGPTRSFDPLALLDKGDPELIDKIMSLL